MIDGCDNRASVLDSQPFRMNTAEIVAFLKNEIEQITQGRMKLDYAMLMLSGETKFKVKVDEAKVDWRKVRTVGDLAGLVAASRKVA
jgi:hypothetical protein